jgi:hypothetical protein
LSTEQGDLTVNLDRLGHLGFVALWSGQLMLTQSIAEGWLVRLVGEAIWLGIGIKLRMSSMWFWGMVGIAVETYGWLAWTS